MFVRRCLIALLALAIASASTARPVRADAPATYDAFVKGAVADRGLFTIWHKDGKVYLELQAAQLDHDYIQTIVPASGIGGQFVVWGNTDHLPTELVRFERAGNNVAILWPAPYFVAPHSPAAALAIDRSFARSIVGLAAIAASDDKTGAVVIDAAPFLDDQLNLKAILAQNLHDQPKAEPYSLDRDHSYFGKVKDFPKNVVIEALQAWTSADQRIADAVPDPRHLQMRVVYNIAEAPQSDDYRPRYADDRVGIYNDIYLSFDNDDVLSRKLRYVVRWNMQPSDPSQAVSPAKHPMVFYMSKTIPQEHRAGIRAAVLKWNDAFLKIGISDALQVRDQPDDPNWDPDDIRYNVLRWVTEYQPSFGADSQTLYDPRTGEEFRTGILISADVPVEAKSDWVHVIDPVRFGRSTDPMPQHFMDDTWLSVIMHETGHNLGMQHNFIGSRAYTAQQLQSKDFTAKYGIASTVMEYAPTNLWPAKYSQGTYVQTVLGPYDYYAMHWAYAPVPGAKSPEDELPTLRKWAAAWSDPRYRYASDEDVSWHNGHAADPRVEQGILTNDPLGWCAVQLDMDRGVMAKLNALFPQPGEAFEAESRAFRTVFGRYGDCATMPAHYIGGQYLSRAHLGDAAADAPVVPVPRAEQHRAFELLARSLFAANALNVAPALLARLSYSEWAGYGYVGFEGYGNLPQWAYDPPERHDFPVAEQFAEMQSGTIHQMFMPSVLARLADGPSETSDRNAMQLSDLFDWMNGAVFAELRAAHPIAPSRRALQQTYAGTLIALYATPAEGAPDDARALARAALVRLETDAARALRGRATDAVTRAHLELLRSRVHDALHAGATLRPAGGS